MLNPVQLRALTEVVRTGSFTEAAKKLGYTSSAVSQQIAALERGLGMQLVTREAHRIRCTTTAQRLASRSVHVLGLLTSLEDDVRALASGEIGRLRIGTALDPTAGLIAPTLRALKALHPRINLSVSEQTADELVESLEVGALDVALVYDYPAAPRAVPRGLTSVELGQEPWDLVTPAGWRDSHELRDLSTHTWVVGLDPGVGQRALVTVCAAAGFSPRISATSTNRDVVLGLVSAGLGVGVLPSFRQVPSSEVGLRPLAEVDATRRTLVLHQRSRCDVPVRTTVQILQVMSHEAALPPDAEPGAARALTWP